MTDLSGEDLSASLRDTQPGAAESGSLWAIGSWLSAALDDPNVCDEMKRDINEWFDGGGDRRTTSDHGAGIDNPECSGGAVVKPPAAEYGAHDHRAVVERVKGRLALSGAYVWLNRTDVEVLLVEALRSEAGERD